MYGELLHFNKWYYLLLLSLVFAFFAWFIQSAFVSLNVYVNTYAEQLSYDRIKELFYTAKRYQFAGYLLLPVLLLAKILYNSFFISMATLLQEDNRYSFSRNFNICLKTECVFVLMNMAKLAWIIFFAHINNVNDVNIIPLSLFQLAHSPSQPGWAVYPLQTINLWELAYCYLGAKLFASQYGISFKKSLKMFCIPYMAGILILMVITAFLTLSLT